MFISISSASVVPAIEVVAPVIVVVAIEAAVVVIVVACKYCLFGQLIISLIISRKFEINLLKHS